jgi:hypothetical protein
VSEGEQIVKAAAGRVSAKVSPIADGIFTPLEAPSICAALLLPFLASAQLTVMSLSLHSSQRDSVDQQKKSSLVQSGDSVSDSYSVTG